MENPHVRVETIIINVLGDITTTLDTSSSISDSELRHASIEIADTSRSPTITPFYDPWGCWTLQSVDTGDLNFGVPLRNSPKQGSPPLQLQHDDISILSSGESFTSHEKIVALRYKLNR
jgi:hypothetical protein